MKTKGISIWEQHLERIVVGFAALVLIGITAMQFIGDPNATQVNGQDVSPGKVDEMVRKEAERLQHRLSPDARPAMTFDDPEPIMEKFENQRLASISPMTTLPQVQPAIVLGDGDLAAPIDNPFNVPTIPAPYHVASAQYFDALSVDAAGLLEQEADLQTMIDELPYDLTWVTTSAQFDVAEVLVQYQTEGANGENAIPTSWYNGRVDIIDVRMEREEYVDGEWVNLALLTAIPGQYTFREHIENEDDMDTGGRDWVVELMADPTIAQDIARPEFYPLVNASWSPPVYDVVKDDPEEILPPEEEANRDLKRNIRQARSDLARIVQRLEDAGGELYPEKSAPGSKDGPGSGSGLGAPGGGLSGSSLGGGLARGGGQGDRDDKRKKDLRIKLTRQRDRKQSRLASYEERLKSLEGDVADVEELVDEGPEVTVTVWGHDITVEPGKTYRYRFTIEVFNPFCARRINLIEEQHELAEGLAMRSATSEWSEPLYAEPPLRVFITGASGPGQGPARLGGLDLGSVSAQVYRFQHSRWWQDDVRVSPGDRIGEVKEMRGTDGSSVEVDFRSDWFVLDVVSDVTADKSARDRRYAARVILQNLHSPEMIVVRLPARDAGSPERLELRDEVDLADRPELALNQ